MRAPGPGERSFRALPCAGRRVSAWLTRTSRCPGWRRSTTRWTLTVPISMPTQLCPGEFGARTVLDIGCGTGTFACLLAGRGLEVIAVDPAAASLEVARRKPGAGRV